MPMRDEQKRPEKLERRPGLFLERPPSTSPQSDEVDEMVPEFMQRGFYRSQEGELEAVEVEPSGIMRAVRPTEGSFRATPLRASQKPLTPPLDAFEPVRSEPRREEGKVDSEPRVAAVESDPPQGVQEPVPQAPPPTRWPRPVETAGLNLPLLLCLFFVVGLFLWREQTRPVAVEQPEFPIPRRVRDTMKDPDANLEQVGRPQPVTTPALVVGPQDDVLPLDGAPVASQSDERGEGLPPEAALDGLEEDPTSLFPSDDGGQPPSAVSQEERDTAAQRAAILDRMSAGTVNRNDREQRMENDLQDGSLFPITEPASPKPQPVTRKPAASRPLAPSVSAAPKEQPLFPVAEPPVQSVTVPAPSAPPAVGNKPKYQIAEPEL